MTDDDCVRFLQWALPLLRLEWRGFRRVRRQVCRRLRRRAGELDLRDLDAYRGYLERHPEEWAEVDAACRVTISRLWRDAGVFALLEREVFPELARLALGRGDAALGAWSAGCASGEEPYSVALAWELGPAPRFPALALRVLATDVDEAVLARARRGCYSPASLRDLPPALREQAFVERNGLLCIRDSLRRDVAFRRHDVRAGPPDGPFDLVLCRNLAFTYFAPDLRREVADRISAGLRPGGALVLGSHELLPDRVAGLAPWSATHRVYRRRDDAG